jgi:hypothetical protein
VLAAFLLDEYGKISNEDFWYDFVNLLGGVGLAFYAYESAAYLFVVTNGIWALASGLDVVRYFVGSRRRH